MIFVWEGIDGLHFVGEVVFGYVMSCLRKDAL
jgi:hypothetical protein